MKNYQFENTEYFCGYYLSTAATFYLQTRKSDYFKYHNLISLNIKMKVIILLKCLLQILIGAKLQYCWQKH
jgi:hypothetical protein